MSALACMDLRLKRHGQTVLEGASLALEPGAVTAILGPNGAGKSSLLAALTGLLEPDGGDVCLDGRALGNISPRERARRIGYLPQLAEVHWNLSVEALVALGRLPHGASPENVAAIRRAIADADIEGLVGRRVSRLSGGERARVLLARLFAGEPDWLLADEPLANLDPAHQLAILRHLRDQAGRGRGVVLVLHDLHLAARFADRIVLMRAGRVIADGVPADILTASMLERAFDVPFGPAEALLPRP